MSQSGHSQKDEKINPLQAMTNEALGRAAEEIELGSAIVEVYRDGVLCLSDNDPMRDTRPVTAYDIAREACRRLQEADALKDLLAQTVEHLGGQPALRMAILYRLYGETGAHAALEDLARDQPAPVRS